MFLTALSRVNWALWKELSFPLLGTKGFIRDNFLVCYFGCAVIWFLGLFRMSEALSETWILRIGVKFGNRQ